MPPPDGDSTNVVFDSGPYPGEGPDRKPAYEWTVSYEDGRERHWYNPMGTSNWIEIRADASKTTPIEQWERVPHPVTGEIFALHDPLTNKTISVPRAPQLGPKEPAQRAPRITRVAGGGTLESLKSEEQSLVDRYNEQGTNDEERIVIAARLDKIQGEIVAREREDRLRASQEKPAQRAPRYPDEVALAEAQAELARANAAKAWQSLRPEQEMAVQNLYTTIRTIEGMMAREEIEPDEANEYIAASRRLVQAQLRGATPFEEAKERRIAEQGRREIGRDLLNQRLSSGAGLASSLVSAAGGLAQRGILQPGQRIEFDPLAAAQQFTQEMGGGQEVGAFAQSLLTGGQGGDQQQAFPMTREDVIAMYPELAGGP